MKTTYRVTVVVEVVEEDTPDTDSPVWSEWCEGKDFDTPDEAIDYAAALLPYTV